MTIMKPNARGNKSGRMFPKLPAVPSGLRSVLLNPDLQMQDLIDQMNNQDPIPATPVTKISTATLREIEERLRM